MFTIFSAPKPFQGHAGIIQRNAVESWKRLGSGCEVILFGNDRGTEDVAREVGVRHIPLVLRNEYGTPLISDIFAQAQAHARCDLLCYVNADIILMADFEDAVRRVASFVEKFLMIGRRCNIDIDRLIDFRGDWQAELRSHLRERGCLGAPTGLDFFAFRRGAFVDMPCFAVGRPAWDAWTVCDALKRGMAVFDATPSVVVVHQNHDYSHVKDGTGRAWEGPEADTNRALATQNYPSFKPWHYQVQSARWVVYPSRILPAVAPKYVSWRWRVLADSAKAKELKSTTVTFASKAARASSRAGTFASKAARASSRAGRYIRTLMLKAGSILSVFLFIIVLRPRALFRRLTRPRRLRRLIGLGYRVQHGTYVHRTRTVSEKVGPRPAGKGIT